MTHGFFPRAIGLVVIGVLPLAGCSSSSTGSDPTPVPADLSMRSTALDMASPPSDLATECNDGNTMSGDGCSVAYRIESGWTCTGSPSQCRPIAGDGKVVGSEQCDDGNTVSDDGCSASGAIEGGSQCTGMPSLCTLDSPGVSIFVGAETAGVFSFPGFIDEVRITKGVARYTGAFTPPAAAFDDTDPLRGNTALLLHLDTALGDSAGKPVTAYMGAALSATQSKFGGASASFNGTGARLVTPDHAALRLGTGDFTMEAWIYPTALGGYASIVSKRDGTPQATGFVFRVDPDARLAFTDGDTYFAAGGAVARNAWHHAAATRQAGTVHLYLNGVEVGSGACTQDLSAPMPKVSM